MKPTLQVRLSQHLALTPQLQQSIRLLQLSTLELHQEVGQMLEQNPFLDVEEDSPSPFETPLDRPPADAAPADRIDEPSDSAERGDGAEAIGEMRADDFGTPGRDDWENGTEGDDFDGIRETPGRVQRDGGGDDDGEMPERRGADISLTEHLRRQAISMRLSAEDRVALLVLIESLDGDGYLADPLEEIGARLLEMGAAALATQEVQAAPPANGRDAAADGDAADAPSAAEAMQDRLRCALRWLQSLDPPGVGARDLGECLALQLRHHPRGPARSLALRIAQNYLELLAKRDIRRLMSLTGATEELVREAQALIVACEPKPGRPFSDAEANIVVPDVIVRKSGRGLAVALNPDVMPKLRINDLYAQAARAQRGANGNPGLSARLQEARWFVKNVQQRFDTILRVSRAIVERQRAFFTHGAIAMKPLVLREIADELGLHESTISRVTTAKYMATPQGTFELKYFFGSSLNTEAGGNASSTAVRALIQRFVAAEDAAKPLSDSQISQMLEEQGIQVARRTVAKYREALKIAPAALRKSM
ncbi:MAG: RNA polymerase factor sigma-54 [Rubrivivax sp.]|nr:RNA polymerase factor sigma-54 [Rubrivivax sp.]